MNESSDIGFFNIHFNKSIDNGSTWTTEVIATDYYQHCYNPTMCVDSLNNLYIVYFTKNNTTNNYQLIFMKSTDRGNTWSSKNITKSDRDSTFPAICIDGNDTILYIFY